MLGRTAGGLLRFLSAWEFESRVFPEIPKFGGFASPARYFYFTLSDFSNMRLLFLITLVFLLYVQKSRTSVRDFCLHLFCQCKLVPVVGLEPTRHRWRRILNPLRLPIPSHRRLWFSILALSQKFKRNFSLSSKISGPGPAAAEPPLFFARNFPTDCDRFPGLPVL